YLYDLFNKKYFKGKLPNLYVHYGKTRRGCMGRTGFKKLCKRCCTDCIILRAKYANEIKNNRLALEITISNKLKKDMGTHQSIVTLLHEMIHVSIGEKYQHGPKFRKEMKRLLRA